MMMGAASRTRLCTGLGVVEAMVASCVGGSEGGGVLRKGARNFVVRSGRIIVVGWAVNANLLRISLQRNAFHEVVGREAKKINQGSSCALYFR